eukprot:GHVQ01004868.1.p4 GENE.GHVQ01004868.1~~GHVQ01004868.1.p4  ORF type:complete len:108 (-),score=13.60 GHVQ01004868.1:570-893(-)
MLLHFVLVIESLLRCYLVSPRLLQFVVPNVTSVGQDVRATILVSFWMPSLFFVLLVADEPTTRSACSYCVYSNRRCSEFQQQATQTSQDVEATDRKHTGGMVQFCRV